MTKHIIIFQTVEKYIPKKQFSKPLKVIIKYREIKLLRFLKYFGIDWYKRYFFKITYKNNSSILFSININNRNELKNIVSIYNSLHCLFAL